MIRKAQGGGRFEELASYSRAKRVGPFVYVAGTTAIEPSGKLHAPGEAYAQTLYILGRIEQALAVSAREMKPHLFLVSHVHNQTQGVIDGGGVWLVKGVDGPQQGFTRAGIGMGAPANQVGGAVAGDERVLEGNSVSITPTPCRRIRPLKRRQLAHRQVTGPTSDVITGLHLLCARIVKPLAAAAFKPGYYALLPVVALF